MRKILQTMKKRDLHEVLSRWPRYSFSVIWMLIILLACLIDPRPLTEDLPNIFGLDKIAHFVLYFVLTALIIWEHNGRRLQGKLQESKKLFWIILIISCVLGALIEYLQGLTSYRGLDEMDLVADIVGALFAYLFYYILLFKNKNTHEKN